MADLLNGNNAEGGEDFCETLYNLIKNNWRNVNPIVNFTGLQAGMIVSRISNEKLYHITDASPGHDEILQENNSADSNPRFNTLQLTMTEAAVSDPPLDAELDALFGNPASWGNGRMAVLFNTISGGNVYWITARDSAWWWSEFTMAL